MNPRDEELTGAVDTFVVEARDLLQDMETTLLRLESEADPQEAVNAVFRAVHTIKGSAGLFGLHHVVRFAHTVETVLDRLRDGEISVSADLVGALLPCRDHLATMVDDVATGNLEPSDEGDQAGALLLARLTPFLATNAPDPVHQDREVPAPDGAGPRMLHLSLRFGQDCLRNGMDPLSFLRYLSTVGEVVDLLTVTEAVPDAETMDPESCYLGFEVALRTSATVETVLGIFDFVNDESDIRVLLPGVTGPLVDLVLSHGRAGNRVRRFLSSTGALVVDQDTGTPDPECPTDRDTGSIPAAPIPSQGRPEDSGIPGNSVQDEPRGGVSRDQVRTTDNRNIRVNALRLDRLIDAVGELVIAGAAARLRAANTGSDDVQEALGDVMRLVEEVRDSALQLRMVPIGTTFSRFQRVVRDVSTELGKDISLVISGGDTEVDKALVEQIGDPLLHLVRNSIDHGIESPEVRVAQGKPARGTLRLNAFHDSGSIVIEVQDDGAGIDRDQVLRRALETGAIEPGATLTDAEVNALIFEPGLSTASELSDLSGRGVGMDVVKRNVTALRGSIDVESSLGRGTTIRIRLPLTLAIIDGFLVGVGGTAFVIPLDRVVECVELPGTLGESRECMDLRGEVLPFIRLRSRFTISGDRPRRENVVVVDHAGTKTGLVVDTLMGEFQTVIKPLGRLFQHVRGVGGATILGDGEVALILDVPMLVRHRADQVQDQYV